MNNKQALQWGQRYLSARGIATARLDALVLLEDNTHRDRAHLLAEPDELIGEERLKTYKKQLYSRAKHFPLAYIRGKSEFYGREFLISKSVLEPRPESESMIDELKALKMNRGCSVIDVGTGSGALIITARLEAKQISAYATDVSAPCLALAKKNAARYGSAVTFFRGDLLKPLPAKVIKNSVLMANLPYVPDSWQINPPAMREPKIAIFGGADGLEVYRQLFAQIAALDARPSWILTEALPPQHESLALIANACDYALCKTNDFIQVFKNSLSQV